MIRSIARALLCLGALTMSQSTAHAQQKLRFAYLKSTTLLPFFLADQKGYFKEEGLELEFIAVAGGPAVAAAISGGSADIGYAAPTPIAIAREQGQPYRFFIGLEREKFPTNLWGHIIASERSGVKSLTDLAGKTIILGAPGGLCELAVREWVAKGGAKWTDIKPLFQPFPQMQAALEVGNADVACIIEPFYTAAMASKANPVRLASGYLAEHPKPYAVDGIFAKEDWIAANAKAIEGIKRAVLKAGAELAKDPVAVAAILKDEFRFPPALVAKIRTDYGTTVGITAEDFEPIITQMKVHGMLKSGITAADLVSPAK